MTVPVDWAELVALAELARVEERAGRGQGLRVVIESERWRRYRDAYEKRRAHLEKSRRITEAISTS